MNEKEVSEKQIQDKLNEIMLFDGDFVDASKVIRLLAKLIFNLRFDLDELKVKLYETIMGEEMECEVNHKEEEEDGRFYT